VHASTGKHTGDLSDQVFSELEMGCAEIVRPDVDRMTTTRMSVSGRVAISPVDQYRCLYTRFLSAGAT